MSTIFVDNDKSTTFISEEKSTGMYFLLNYRLIKNSSCKHRHMGSGFFFSFSILSIKCASTTYMNPFDMLRCEIHAFMNYAPFS